MARRPRAVAKIPCPLRCKLSEHAQKEIERRRIPRALVEGILENPDQILPERGILKAYQSKCEISVKMYVVRVIVDDSLEPAVVVTAYRSSKVEKYWGKP
jgi:Domain of unknown function (DUF4258)